MGDHQTHKMGAITELRAASFFIRAGWTVYWPAVQQGQVDFVIEREGIYRRVQVKTARWVDSKNHTYLRAKTKPCYNNDSFDLFVPVAGDKLWVLPWPIPGYKEGITVINLARQDDPEWRHENLQDLDDHCYPIIGEDEHYV
jgi:hypothetical protein